MIEFASCLLSGEGAPRIRLETPDPVAQLASIPAADSERMRVEAFIVELPSRLTV